MFSNTQKMDLRALFQMKENYIESRSQEHSHTHALSPNDFSANNRLNKMEICSEYILWVGRIGFLLMTVFPRSDKMWYTVPVRHILRDVDDITNHELLDFDGVDANSRRG